MREIVFDTETTGFDPKTGDRIVEFGAIEMINHTPTGAVFHEYINPQRDMPQGAFEVHGLSEEFLSDKPLFEAIAEPLLAFIGDANLVAHNAQFDMKFLNFELRQAGHEPIVDQARVVDTLELARRKFPNGPNSLDHLCTRFGIDNSRRTKHGALLDSELLAEVYVELLGGRQTSLNLAADVETPDQSEQQAVTRTEIRQRPQPLPSRLSDRDRAAHKEMVGEMSETALWHRYDI